MAMLSSASVHVHSDPADAHPSIKAVAPNFIPTATDHAWWSGFQLGIEGVPANPPDDLSPAERAAFESGHDIGHARFEEDCQFEFGELLARLEWAAGDPWDRMHQSEVERVLGHRAFSLVEGAAW